MENIVSVIIYLATFAASSSAIFFGFKKINQGKRVLGASMICLGVLMPSILAGIRQNVGVDFPTYLKMYNNVIDGKPMYFRSIEPISTLIITVSAYMRSSVFMFFVFSLITNACFFLAFMRLFGKDSKKTTIAYLLYLCIIFPTTLNAVRSGAAISLVTLALSFFLQKWSYGKIIKGATLILLAFLFHRSAIMILIFAPVIILLQIKNKNKYLAKKIILWFVYLLPFILLPVVFSVVKGILPLGDYVKYTRRLGEFFSIPLANILMAIPVIYAFVYYRARKKEEKFDEQFEKILYLALFYIPLSILVGWLTYAKGISRISFILDPVIICLMVLMVTHSKTVPKIWRIITIVGISLVVGAMFIRNLNWSKDLPYKTVFSEVSVNASKD